MRLLFDENLSSKLPNRLGDLFPNSLHVRDVGMKATIDPIVWNYAKDNDLMIGKNWRSDAVERDMRQCWQKYLMSSQHPTTNCRRASIVPDLGERRSRQLKFLVTIFQAFARTRVLPTAEIRKINFITCFSLKLIFSTELTRRCVALGHHFHNY